MLGTYGRDDAPVGLDQVREFPDIAHIPGSHLRDEDAVGILHMLPDGPHQAHGSIEGGRRRADTVLDRKHVPEEELDRGLSIGTGHPDDLHAGRPVGGQNPFRIFNEIIIDALLNRRRAEVGEEDEAAGKRQHQVQNENQKAKSQ